MINFKKLNIITGWLVFLVATVTYVLTLEPTTSFWDCGEFIASAFKLEVGHPPGAPFFMIISRFFSLFAFGDLTQVAKMINLQSALSSSFTILFLFWSITHLAKKLIVKVSDSTELDLGQTIAIVGSGVVGALAYTFSDTFWFSAVEAEVYAMSSLFTAAVFWAILKWENEADEPNANRWIVLIAYLMGLSIGVHLLNLLAIPAIVLVYYFKKYKFSVKGLLISIITSFILVVVLMYGIIQGLVILGTKFELIFVNSIGLPFSYGFIIYLILLVIGAVAGIYFSHKYKKPILNTIIVSFTVILIGYSSFAMIMIRSTANPPMDENNPENAFNLQSYLNREQYGDTPLIYGEYYNAEPTEKVDNYTYIQGAEKYEKITKTNPTYIYDKKFCTIFPRMFSSTSSHISAYKEWGDITIPDTQKPSFISNIKYFVQYQIGHMYLRYFMWNFSGRQNDEQGHGGYTKGNWITGINFIDALRLGPQTDLPDSVKEHKSRNKYFLLPFILGLIGLIYAYSNHKKDFWVVFALFFMTGIAIVLYLNQTPYQPRERDYAYAGSFYAFSIWIGLSVLAIFDGLRRIKDSKVQAIIAVVVTIIIPFQMAAQNWDDHNRSGRYTARDFAVNYLNSCEKNAILFTYGDNDTFPLWYAQEVEGVRTDIRVVNLSLLSTDWYIDQMCRKAYESDTLPISFTPEQYVQGKRDISPLYDVPEYLFDEKFDANFNFFKDKYIAAYTSFMGIIEKSKFPELHIADYKLLKDNGYNSITPLKFFTIVNTLSESATAIKYNVDLDTISGLKIVTDKLMKEISESYVPLKDVIKFVASDSPESKVPYGTSELSFLPSSKFLLPVDKNKIVELGIVNEEDKNDIVEAIRWQMTDSYILKSNLIVLDILANNNWQRPIYFATSVGEENYMGLQEYFRLEGFAYRLIPVKTPIEDSKIGNVDTDILYENLMNKFTWGRVNEEDVLVDAYVQRVISIMEIRDVFNRLASTLIAEGDSIKAVEVLDRCIEVLPDNKYPYDYSVLTVIENYYLVNENEKANEIVRVMAKQLGQELKYYSNLSGAYVSNVQREKTIANYLLNQLIAIAQTYNQLEILDELYPIYSEYGEDPNM